MFQVIDPGFQPEIITVNFYSIDNDGAELSRKYKALQIDEDHLIFNNRDEIVLHRFYKGKNGPEIGDRSEVLCVIHIQPEVYVDLNLLANLTLPELMMEVPKIKHEERARAKTFI